MCDYGIDKWWLEESEKDNPQPLKFLDSNLDAYKLRLNIVNKSNNQIPQYESTEASGFDLRAYLREPIILKSLERYAIPTGLYFDIPTGFEIQVRPRSGLAAKNGITVLNTPGTVDSDYTGEIKIILVNLSKDDFTINNGDRIAQAVLASVTNSNIFNFNFVDKISKITERGDSGFGSTGVK